MDFSLSPKAASYLERVERFVRAEIEPAEQAYLSAVRSQGDRRTVPPVIDELKAKARAEGLWNLFLPDERHGAGLATVDYAPLAEVMGRSPLAPEVFNCNAPDTGNMEVLLDYGSAEQKARWLRPLLDGEIRSAFAMTEPEVASSDATNIAATVRLDGDEVVLNGRKWWTTGAGHPRCEFLIFMGRTNVEAPRHAQHTMVLVPMETPGVRVERLLSAMGYHDEPAGHGEVSLTDVRLPRTAMIGRPGQAFEIAQSRLGRGRVHHCMRLIGMAERALELACRRATSRIAFGRQLADLGGNRERIADARIAIEQARLHVLKTAWLLDTGGAKAAMSEISQIKASVPRTVQGIVDMAIQLHGGAGLTDDFPLAAAWTAARSLRLADGPDEVHRAVVARLELRKYGDR